jgi:hypothetical protein
MNGWENGHIVEVLRDRVNGNDLEILIYGTVDLTRTTSDSSGARTRQYSRKQ